MIAAAWEHAALGFILASLLGAGLAWRHDHRLDVDELSRHFRTTIREDNHS